MRGAPADPRRDAKDTRPCGATNPHGLFYSARATGWHSGKSVAMANAAVSIYAFTIGLRQSFRLRLKGYAGQVGGQVASDRHPHL